MKEICCLSVDTSYCTWEYVGVHLYNYTHVCKLCFWVSSFLALSVKWGPPICCKILSVGSPKYHAQASQEDTVIQALANMRILHPSAYVSLQFKRASIQRSIIPHSGSAKLHATPVNSRRRSRECRTGCMEHADPKPEDFWTPPLGAVASARSVALSQAGATSGRLLL